MSALTLIRTDSHNTDFNQLRVLLDNDLALRDGDEHAFYAQFNHADTIKEVVIGYKNEIPVACGAIKCFSEKEAEIKRMFVHPEYRQQGIAIKILAELEKWAIELGFSGCVLETGKMNPEAIALYQKLGYQIGPNYGQYIGIENSVCMSKRISHLDT